MSRVNRLTEKVSRYMGKLNEIDRRVLAAMDGRERLKLLLKDRGLQLQDFAKKHNLWVETVSMCIKGDREYPEIREALAVELELSRDAIDLMIDGMPVRKAEGS